MVYSPKALGTAPQGVGAGTGAQDHSVDALLAGGVPVPFVTARVISRHLLSGPHILSARPELKKRGGAGHRTLHRGVVHVPEQSVAVVVAMLLSG